MLISCSSCKAKYLVNSADLKPTGRIVQCARCGHNWFQTTSNENDEEDFQFKNKEESNYGNNENIEVKNLPSTYVKEQKVSILNSFLAIFFLFIIIISFWFFKENGFNFFVLIKFYLNEFYFNLKLLVSDLAQVVYKILN